MEVCGGSRVALGNLGADPGAGERGWMTFGKHFGGIGTGAASEAPRGAHPHFTLPPGGKSEVFRECRCGAYIVNNRSESLSAPFLKKSIFEAIGRPFYFTLGSIWRQFAPLWRPKWHFWPHWGALVRTFAQSKRTGGILMKLRSPNN